jgi:glycerol transport system ATP-binding protein
MNFIPAQVAADKINLAGTVLEMPHGKSLPDGEIKLGIRPEYVVLAPPNTAGALPMTVTQMQDVGTHIILAASSAGQSIKARLSVDSAQCVKGDLVWLKVLGEHTCIYKNEEIVA